MLMKKEIIEDNKKLKEENKELKQKVKYYENFEINKTVDKIRLENNKREKELQNQLQQKDKEIERLNYRIKRIAYQCYKSDMSYDEFKHIWVNAMGKIYEPSQIDELEKELGVIKSE